MRFLGVGTEPWHCNMIKITDVSLIVVKKSTLDDQALTTSLGYHIALSCEERGRQVKFAKTIRMTIFYKVKRAQII